MEEEDQASSCTFLYFSILCGKSHWFFKVFSESGNASPLQSCNPQSITLTSLKMPGFWLLRKPVFCCFFFFFSQIPKPVPFYFLFFVVVKITIIIYIFSPLFSLQNGHPKKQLHEITCRQGTCEPVNPRQIELSWFLKSSKIIMWLVYSLELSPSTLGWVRAMSLAWSNVFLWACSLLLLPAFKCTVCSFLRSCHGIFFSVAWPLWSHSHSHSLSWGCLWLPWQDFHSFQPKRFKPVQQHPESAQLMYFTDFFLAVSWSPLFC